MKMLAFFEYCMGNACGPEYSSIAWATLTVLSIRPRRTNHMDGQIFTPPYLLNPDSSLATRPNITVAPPATALPGDVLNVVTDSLAASFSFIRRGCEACFDPAIAQVQP